MQPQQTIGTLKQELFRLLDALSREPTMHTPVDLQSAALAVSLVYIGDDQLQSHIDGYIRRETLEDQTASKIRLKARSQQPPLSRNMRAYKAFSDAYYPVAHYEAAQHLQRLLKMSLDNLQRVLRGANDRASAALEQADRLDELVRQITADPEGEDLGWMTDKGAAKASEIRAQAEHYRQVVVRHASNLIEQTQQTIALCQTIEQPTNRTKQSYSTP